MVMTTGTRNRQSQNRSSDDIDLVVHIVSNHLLLVDIARNEIRNSQHSRGYQRVGIDL